MGRDDDIAAIVDVGRRTRAATPGWLWVAAAIAGAIGLVGFAVVVLGDDERPRPALERREAPRGGGLGTGLVIGAGAGLLVGYSIARQARDHSSRRRP